MSRPSPLRAAGLSALALVMVSTAGVTLAVAGPSGGGIALATPAEREQIDAEQAALAQREALIISREAERRADALELVAAADARADTLASTTEAIGATEKAVIEERAAAARAAEEYAHAARVGAERANRGVPVSVPGDNPKANKELARRLAQEIYQWGEDQFTCYDNIIMRESKWVTNADNPISSAYGIPQALPGNKMATVGDDWAINPETQIKWGLKYVKDRFGNPCSAWSFKRAHGWY